MFSEVFVQGSGVVGTLYLPNPLLPPTPTPKMIQSGRYANALQEVIIFIVNVLYHTFLKNSHLLSGFIEPYFFYYVQLTSKLA